MTLLDIIKSPGGIIFIVLTLVQIAPIKINPWSSIAKFIGHALNGEIRELLNADKADTRRYRILRFNDELLHNQRHTREHYNQILDDITEYEQYCTSHPDYKNNKAVLAIENIKSNYKNCVTNNSFLQ